MHVCVSAVLEENGLSYQQHSGRDIRDRHRRPLICIDPEVTQLSGESASRYECTFFLVGDLLVSGRAGALSDVWCRWTAIEGCRDLETTRAEMISSIAVDI